MSTLMERVGNERRRLRTVRQNMMAAVERKASGDEAYIPLYIAAADYIEATMARLHKQDVRMGDMIREKVETVDTGVEQALQQLSDRLSGAEAHLKPFLAARDALRKEGKAALESFEKSARVYSDFIVANMGHHGPTSDLSAKLFSTSDWEYMAGITGEEEKREADLFERVESSLPDELKNISG